MFEAAITVPCLATLRINRRSKTNTRLESWKLRATAVDLSGTLNQTVGGQLMMQHINNNYTKLGRSETLVKKKKKRRRRVFFLDDNPLSCNGSTPTLQSFADPVVAVSSFIFVGINFMLYLDIFVGIYCRICGIIDQWLGAKCNFPLLFRSIWSFWVQGSIYKVRTNCRCGLEKSIT